MARACGSYPQCHWFESYYRHQWPDGQAVKTPPFHGGITGSIPVRVTIWEFSSAGRASALQAEGQRFEPVNSHQKITTQSGGDFSFKPTALDVISPSGLHNVKKYIFQKILDKRKQMVYHIKAPNLEPILARWSSG